MNLQEAEGAQGTSVMYQAQHEVSPGLREESTRIIIKREEVKREVKEVAGGKKEGRAHYDTHRDMTSKIVDTTHQKKGGIGWKRLVCVGHVALESMNMAQNAVIEQGAPIMRERNT